MQFGHTRLVPPWTVRLRAEPVVRRTVTVIQMELLVKYVGGCTRDVVLVNACVTRELTPLRKLAAAPSVSFKIEH